MGQIMRRWKRRRRRRKIRRKKKNVSRRTDGRMGQNERNKKTKGEKTMKTRGKWKWVAIEVNYRNMM